MEICCGGGVVACPEKGAKKEHRTEIRATKGRKTCEQAALSGMLT